MLGLSSISLFNFFLHVFCNSTKTIGNSSDGTKIKIHNLKASLLVLVELQNTCKKTLNRKMLERRMSNMTFPCVNTIQLGPSPFNS